MMKKTLVLFFLVSFSMALFAKAKTEMNKIAVVNIEQAILSTELAKAQITKLEADPDFKKNIESLKKIQGEGQELTEKYKKDGQMMSQADLRKLEDKIKAKQADLEHTGKKLQETRNNLLKSLMIQMNADMTRSVKEIIDAEGIGLLMPYNPQLMLHVDSSFDITPKLTAKLNAQFKAK